MLVLDATGHARRPIRGRATNLALHPSEKSTMAIDDTNQTEPSIPAVGAVPPASNTPPTVPQFLPYREAYERALPATAALSEDELLHVNIDLPRAVATAIAALPRIMAYRDEAAKLNGFDTSHFDELQLHAFAVGHAHVKFLVASAPPEALATLNESALELRDTIYHDAVALAHRGLIRGERVAEFKANVGYQNLAFDLLGLSDLLRQNWEQIASRSAVQLGELDQAELIGQQLMDAVGTREQAAALMARAQAQRQRNFTLFSRSYDQVRRAIGFLRWNHEDVDQICPSLFAGRGGSRRKEPPAPTPPGADP